MNNFADVKSRKAVNYKGSDYLQEYYPDGGSVDSASDRVSGGMSVEEVIIPASLVDRLFRLLRQIVGGSILLILVLSMLVPSIVPVTGQSIVNAELVWLRTRINGIATFSQHRLGESVTADDVLASVVNDRVDDGVYNQLEQQQVALNIARDELVRKREYLRAKMTSVQSYKAKADKKNVELKELKRNRLAKEIDSYRKERLLTLDKIQRFLRANRLFSNSVDYGVVSRREIDEKQFRLDEIELLLGNGVAQLKQIDSDIKSLRNNNHAEKNVSFEKQIVVSLGEELNENRDNLNRIKSQIGHTEDLLKSRSDLLDSYRQHQIKAGVNGVLWEFGYPNRSLVHNGDSLVAIAATETLVIESIFHQRYLDSIAVNDHATIALIGSNRKLQGRIAKILIRNTNGGKLNAFSIGSPEKNEFKVLIKLNEGFGEGALIGQRAKVVITKNSNSRIPDFLFMFNR